MSKKNKDNNNNNINTDISINEIDEDTSLVEAIDDESNRPLSLHELTGNGKDIFSTYKSKYENTMSSAVILIFFGIAGIISTILFVSGTIKVAMSTFQYVFLGIVYIAFLVYGIISFMKAKEYKSKISDEDNHEEHIQKYLKETITQELLDSFKDNEISDEENYVLAISKIQEMLLKEYPDYDQKLIEYHIDEYLNEYF